MQTKTTNGADRDNVRAGLGAGLSLGRVAGIEVRLHWTWLVAAVLIASALAGNVFPSEVGGLPQSTYIVMGATTSLLFFLSLLLHELGHALAARREGIPTRGITLWALGGVAQSGAPFPTPGAEARIALAGPAVSAVLGGGLVAAGNVAGLPDSLAAILEWLGWTNLLLLVFNLLPALPLDGGRVLRAALWRIRRSHLKATRGAARVSQVLSVAMMAVGTLAAFGAGALGGLWLAFIGFFVYSQGTAERALAEAQAALAGVHVEEVMTRDPITIASSASAQRLLEIAGRAGHTTYPVLDEHEEVIGLVSALTAERVPERRRAWVQVRTLLADTPQPSPLDADVEVLSVVPVLARSPLHRAAVVRAGRLVGLISLGDVIRVMRLRGSDA